MKSFLGVLMIVMGVLLGLFVGGYLFLYGGIIQVVNGVQADPMNAEAIAIGVIRFMLTSLAFWFSALVLILPGAVILGLRQRK